MAITGTGLASAIKAKLLTPDVTNEAELETFCKGIGEAVVEYLTANAEVIIAPASIATTGDPTAHTGPATPVILTIS